MTQPPVDPQRVYAPQPLGQDASSEQPRTAAELLAAYGRGERTFSYWNLAAADLRNAILKDANFYGANLRGADFSGADLTRCNFAQGNLSSANLRGANISQAYFDRSITDGADMAEVITDRPSEPAAPSATPAMAPQAAPVPMAQPSVRFCAYCGTSMPADGVFCQTCGRQQPVPGAATPLSTPLSYGGPALPSSPFFQQQSMPPANPYGAYAAPSTPLQGAYGPPSTPLQPAAYSTPLRPLAQQRPSLIGVMIATIGGAIATLAFFLPAYVSAGNTGASGPQVAGAFGTVASLCSQYSGYVQQSSQASGACGFASIAGPALWLEMILAAVAAIVAAWQWYNARQTGLPVESRAGTAILITGGISLLILLFQFLILPSLLSAATGVSAVGSAVTAAFGSGFWLMVLGTIGTVAGAVMQLRAS